MRLAALRDLVVTGDSAGAIARIADLRREALHQASTALVCTAEVICLEDLDVKAMGRSMGQRAFRRSVADGGLGELRRQITYKASWHGRAVSLVDRFYPCRRPMRPAAEHRRRRLHARGTAN